MKTLLTGLALVFLLVPVPAAAPPSRAARQKAEKALREVAGTAEYLRSLPKRFGTLTRLDAAARKVWIRFEGEKEPREWSVFPEAEVKVSGWWGRLDQLTPGERVWAWMMTDRKSRPVAVVMLADDLSQQDIHGTGLTVKHNAPGKIVLKPDAGKERVLTTARAAAFRGGEKAAVADFKPGSRVFVRSKAGQALELLDQAAFERRRQDQRQALRKRWVSEGLPGSVGFVHVFSGELDLLLDHEAVRWGRSLNRGDRVTLLGGEPIAAVVKDVQPWRERTQVRLVAKSTALSELRAGERVRLRMPPPASAVEESRFPPDVGRTRTREQRVEWFLASIYCTCGVRGDTCTGHFYTLSSCNPNSCGKPNQMRKRVAKLLDEGLSDQAVFEKLLAEEGPGLLQPHLLP